MPARELGRSINGPSGTHVGTTFELFKRHKVLPHPRENRSLDLYTPGYTPKSRVLAIDTGISSAPSSDASSPRILKHASRRIGVPDLPPTPPTHSRQSSQSSQSNYPTISPPRYGVAEKSPTDIPSAPSTPPHHKSPPTPDVTPPRAMPPLAFRPPTNDRYPSSRTDSFKTARENPYSSDEDEVSTVRPVLPSTRPSENEIPQALNPVRKRKEVGLGLGLESDDGASTPRPNADSQKEFVVFDGEWGSTGDVSEVEREWDDNLMRNVTVRKRPGAKRYMLNNRPANEVLEDDIVSPTNATKVVRGLPLHERIARHRSERETEQVEPVTWSKPEATPDSPISDVKRFSTISGRSVTSTVIEAIVVDAPPSRRKTLRHTRKQIALRDFSSDNSTKDSAPNSVVSGDLQNGVVHQKTKAPDQRHRSLASNTTISTASSSGRSRREIIGNGGIPVVVIPDRRSSTKSSRAPSLRSTSSRRTKRSISLSSAPVYFDDITSRKRTLSDSVGSGQSVRTLDFPPSIPARRSSLSAPTSRNNSRAGSLTAESLNAHNMTQQKTRDALNLKLTRILSPVEPRVDSMQHARLSVDHNGDPFFRPSTQVTPFSQTSYETGGTTAEVSEAMAVSIFPHQNKSVLVVEHEHAPSQNHPSTMDSNIGPQPNIATDSNPAALPVTPPQTFHPMDEVDSPLRNPRVPPEPPSIKFIPPTPAVFTPGEEEDRQLGYGDNHPATSDSKTKRGMSLMRRAFSNRRRNSEPVIQPGRSILKRTFSLSGKRNESTQTSKGTANPATLYPSVLDRPADDSKLHPFWRPAHFWDDLEANDDSDEDEFGGTYSAPPRRSLSGKLKRTFAILPITNDGYESAKPRRRVAHKGSGENMRVVKKRSQSTVRGGERPDQRIHHESAVQDDRFGYHSTGDRNWRSHTIPGLGVRVSYVGFGPMKRRLSERRRQQRSDKLRESITYPQGVHSGVDDVLRRRNQARSKVSGGFEVTS